MHVYLFIHYEILYFCYYRDYRVLSCMHVYLFIHNEILYFVSTRIIEFCDVCMYIYSYTMRFCTFVITGIIEFCDVCMYIYSYTMRFCTLFHRTPSSLRFYKTAWISSIFLKKTTLSTSLWTPNQVSSSLVACIHIYYIITIAKRDVRLIYWLLHCVLGYIMKYLQSLMHTGQLFLTLHSYLSI